MTHIDPNANSASTDDHTTAVRRVSSRVFGSMLVGLLVLAVLVSGVGAAPDVQPADVEVEEDLFLEAAAIQDPAERADAFSTLAEDNHGSVIGVSSQEAMLQAVKEAMLDPAY